MAFEVFADDERRRLFVVADGVITLDELRAHIVSERSDGALPYRELIDARTAIPDVSPADVREIVGLLHDSARTAGLGPTAVVVSSDYAYGMLRMLEILAEGIAAVRPFRDMAEAERWLASAPVHEREGDGTRPRER
jgi:hypothetical protein